MRMAKQTVIHLYHRIQFSHEKEHAVGMYKNTDKLQKYVEQQSQMQEFINYKSIYMKFKHKHN